jgi:HPt (histidine-containing phosphotransfer) domain-containing protein
MTDEGPVPLDRAELERSSFGDQEFEKELLAEFLGGSSGTLAALAAAVAARNAHDVRHAAHSLKGGCWTVGARVMGASCEELELDARAGVLDRAEALAERIREQFARLDAYVRQHWGL